jgi:hypothetical protein
MFRTSSRWLLRHQWTLAAGASLLLAGCGDSQTGSFSAAASEKAAAENGLAPGTKAQKAAPTPVARGKAGKGSRAPGGATPNPD